MSFSPQDQALVIDPAGFRLAVVAARFNPGLTSDLLNLVLAAWKRAGVRDDQWRIERVPGSNEVPFALRALLQSAPFDAAVGLGVVVAGQTSHHETIAAGTAAEIHRVAAETGVPVINGILVVGSEDQARDRLGRIVDRGDEFAAAALEMGALARRLRPARD